MITDTSKQKTYRSPYEGKRRLSTRAVKKIQSGVRAMSKATRSILNRLSR